MPKFPSYNPQKRFLWVLLALSCCLAGLYIFWHQSTKYSRFEIIKDENTLPLLNPTFKDRKVRKVRLKPNGVTGLLISDPNTDECGVSVVVGMGSFHDPAQYPGFAHLLEHLIMLKPLDAKGKSSFFSMLEDYAGRENAYTAQKYTYYVFSAKYSALKELLGPFVSLFVNRSFSSSDIASARYAVDQERDIALQKNYWRSWAVFHETSPYSFYAGNAQTLKDITSAEVQKLYHQYYGYGKNYYVVILGRESLNTLTSMLVKCFSKIPSGSPPPPLPDKGPILSPKLKKNIVYIKPTQDNPYLCITWELPASYTLEDAQTADVVAYAMNNKEKNSLYRQLRKENMAEHIKATAYRLGDKLCFAIEIWFVKNDQPLPIDRVITRIFQLIKRLQVTGIPEYIFTEKCQMDYIQYTNQERINAFDTVKNLGDAFPYEEPSTFPQKTVLASSTYQASKFNNMLKLLKPQDCFFMIIATSKRAGVIYGKQKEPYKVAYNIVPIPEKKLAAWEAVKESTKIGLPTKNPFISEEFLQHKPRHITPTPKPVVLEETAKGKAFFYGNSSYAEQRIAWWLQIKSPHINNQPRQMMLRLLYLKSLEEDLLSIRQLAARAGLYSSFGSTNYTFDIVIYGYRDKASLLLEMLLSHFKAKKIPTKKQFIQYRHALSVACKNQMKASTPLQQARNLSSDVLYGTPTYAAYLRALSQISYEDFCHFIKILFEKAYVKMFFGGSLSEQEALDNAHKVMDLIKIPYPEQEHGHKKLLLLPSDQGPYKIMENTSMLGHSTRLVLQVGDFSFEKAAAIAILEEVVGVDFYDTLRSKQGVAYKLYVASGWICDQLLLSFNILSGTHSPEELLVRIEGFLEDYIKELDQYIPQDRFEKVRQALIEKLRANPRNLYQACSQLKELAFEYDEDFQRRQKRIEALENMTYETFKKYVISFIARQRKERLAFLIKGKAPNQEKDFVYKSTKRDKIFKKGKWVQKKKKKRVQ